MAKRLEPIHPGEVLFEDFLKPLGISINRLAREIRVPPNRVSAVVNGRRAVTADTALRLARFFGTSPQFWMNLQGRHDLDVAADALADEIERGIRPLDAA